MYQINSDSTDAVYIGSTCDKLNRRMSEHRANYKQYLKGKYNYITAFDILKYGDAEICLIENFPCEDKQQLLQREGFHVRRFKGHSNCVNKYIPGRTKKQYREDKKKTIELTIKVVIQLN